MDKYLHQFRKNGKTVTLLRKVCSACGEEYCHKLNEEDAHRCDIHLTRDEVYELLCDEAYDEGR